jgi:hypothetical protein
MVICLEQVIAILVLLLIYGKRSFVQHKNNYKYYPNNI